MTSGSSSPTPGKNLLVTWAINNGSVGEHPTGTPDCTVADRTVDHDDRTATTTTGPGTSSTTTTTTTTLPESTTTTTSGGGRTTQQQARFEAKQMLASLKTQITQQKLDVPGVQFVGTYPLQGAGDDTVVQVLYSRATVLAGIRGDYKTAFEAPPAEARAVPEPGVRRSRTGAPATGRGSRRGG